MYCALQLFICLNNPEYNKITDAFSPPLADPCPFCVGAMVSAVLKLYVIGTALTVLAVLYGLVDSFGGLMYVQNHNYMLEVDRHTQRAPSSSNRQRRLPMTKNIGS